MSTSTTTAMPVGTRSPASADDLLAIAQERAEAGWTPEQLLTWLRSPLTRRHYDGAEALTVLIGGAP